ncbi:MAG: hypothetical protein CMJ48_05720 [Planctomycetaceae bacterium]|nr:hypothetical protein [Planctomycetaceae bacterium]
MPAWPGGPCPSCGDDMPENLVHCQRCRTLLNDDLDHDSVEIPPFVQLEEISSMVEVPPRGHYIACPQCDKELRINRKYVGEKVQCKFCQGGFRFAPSGPDAAAHAFYTTCPHCSQELRVASKYLGEKVLCKLCDGHIHFVG